ncbi:hypothetical protein [Oceanobacillus picturae]|nr:hypothetical protein [Oceanobacillus picturae]
MSVAINEKSDPIDDMIVAINQKSLPINQTPLPIQHALPHLVLNKLQL